LVNQERFSKARLIVCDDIPQSLHELDINEHCFITIATRSHESDRLALAAAVNRNCGYLGMIGSRAKIKTTFSYLLKQGVSKENIAKIYAPMGLNIAAVRPVEIAMSIMSEILLIKNKGSLEHMRTVKKIRIE